MQTPSLRRILLVDDTPFDRVLISSTLRKTQRFEIVEASDAESALERLNSDTFDLMLTDLKMPRMSGLELVKQVHDRLPTIVLTAFGNEAVAMEALQSGAYSYISKATLSDDLPKQVDRVLKLAAQEKKKAELMGCILRHSVTLQIGNDLSQISATLDYIEKLTTTMNLFCGPQPMHLRLCLEEALSNAVIRGNLEVGSELRDGQNEAYHRLIEERRNTVPYCHRQATIEIDLNRDRARFVIRDEGPGFDIHALPNPLAPENLGKPSGRGVTLMHAFLDEVEYNEWGNEVRLVLKTPARSRIPELGACTGRLTNETTEGH